MRWIAIVVNTANQATYIIHPIQVAGILAKLKLML